MPFHAPRRIFSLVQRCAQAVGVLFWTSAAPVTWAQSSTYVNFEAQQTRPICLSPDGTRLFAVNTPDGRLSVFDVSNPANPLPVLIREIPVGVEPVSVNALSNDEAWVVNEVSDSVSIVSVAAGAVTETLACKDEPADVVFANGRAFVSCAQNNLLRVFDLTTHAETATIPLAGLNPRSLAVSGDGTKIYAAFKLSGNRTTLLPANLAPAPPPPMNASLPPAPQTGMIVNADDPRLSPAPNMPDNDVAEINTGTLSVVRYFHGAGTVNFFIAVRPVSNELWVANTEALNLSRFEPVVKGHAVDNRVTRINTVNAGTVTPFDLNPGVDYLLFPNNTALATALAQPTAIAFQLDGAAFWLASFGTDRVAKIDADTGAVVSRIETGPTTGAAADPRNKRGPRGLAYQATNQRLYVLNRIANTISIVSTASEIVLGEIATGSHDPTSATIRQGRGFLYDARLSGNGTQSCASCHIDGDRDDLAWDLGDPLGSMQTVSTPFGSFSMHPMKGPMTTQTLRGFLIVNPVPSPFFPQQSVLPLHWRGDRATFAAFNPAFASLLGGSQLGAADMSAFEEFVNTIVIQPNPHQNLDRTLPATFPPGDPQAGDPNAGRSTFENDNFVVNQRCTTCHSLPSGTARILVATPMGQSQNFKVPHLRNIYQKLEFRRSAAVSRSGFGLMHDGAKSDLFEFLSQPFFGTLATDTIRQRNLNAFLQCFDTGTAPAVGYTRTVRAATLAASAAEWSVLEAQATSNVTVNACDLIVRLLENGERHGLVYRPATQDYLADQTGLGPFTRAALEAKVLAGATLTLMGTPRLGGSRLALDRDENGIMDGDEPLPRRALSLVGGVPQVAWPAAGAGHVLEFTDSLQPANWQPVTQSRNAAGGSIAVTDPTAGPRRFYRLRRP
jgi:DNA-binding beta-propeller fold protein YncE